MAKIPNTFPNPALEIGVPNYPTPFVPDFYTKQGHIVLVEKVSAEKGSYNPQPLDGSVIYAGRDANKWPSNLYLVAEKPEETGQFVFRYWANDRTLASQDPWNYGLTYQNEHPDYPIITRQYIVPRDDYEPVAIGTADPVFGGDAVITKQATQELPDENPLRSRYIMVQRVYSTIPGPLLEGKVLQEFGIADLKERIVGTGYEPTLTENTVKYELTPVDATQSKLSQVDYIDPVAITGYQYDEFFQANLSLSKQIVEAGAAPLSITNGVLSYKDEPIDPYKSQRIIVSTPSLPPSRTEYKTGTFTSPLLVFGIAAESANFSCGDNLSIKIRLTPNTRSSQSRQTTFKTITSYSYGPPTAGDTDLFAPELKQIAFTGYVINFDLGGGLCDYLLPPMNPTYPVGPQYGILVSICPGLPGVYESWNIPNTTITATQYLGYIGTYKKISWESRYWKANIWESKEVWVKIV